LRRTAPEHENMNDDDGMSSAAGRIVWLELARGGGVLLRDLSEALGNRPSPRARVRGSLTSTSDAPSPSNAT
jgi:hypothetical protein